MPWYLGNSREYIHYGWGAPIAILALWSLVWTGLALWHAAKRGEKWWFLLFLIAHTAGILEILYLAFVVKLFSNSTKKPSSRRRRS